MAEFFGFGVDAPEFVRTRNEFPLLVPALHPSHAVVEFEEADLNVLATAIVNFAVLLPHFIIRDQQVFLENSGVADWNRARHLDVFSFLDRVDRKDWSPFSSPHGGGVGRCIFIGGDEVPSSARDVFVDSWNWGAPMLRLSNWAFASRSGKPFVRREERLSGEEKIWCHSRERVIRS